jgi:DNA-binding helix-hairpin-helix protein with protein kinase domain
MPKVYVNGEELLLQADPAMPPGREGTVYHDPSDPAFVIKMPHAPDEEWREKLRILLANPLSAPDVAWPVEAVYASDRSTIIGCRVPYAMKKYPIAEVFSTDPKTRWIEANYAFRLDVAINLAAAVNRVHQHGCVVGDLSPNNILVGRNSAAVCLIDIDSVQITRNGTTHRCKYAFPDYVPPELHSFDLADIDRTVDHEAFSLACIVFQLLVGPGIHPFAMRYMGAGKPFSLHDRVHLGIWPYAMKRHSDYAPRTDAPFELLHPILQSLMRQCFEDGHSRPHERPQPADLLQALTEAKQDIDFVRITAPRLEADAQARYRQAVLATFRPQVVKKRWAPSIFSRVRGKSLFRFCLSKKLWYSITAATLLLAAGFGLHFLMTRPTKIEFVQKTGRPVSTPALYQDLVAPWQIEPQQSLDRAASSSTPNLYENLAQNPTDKEN